MCSTKHTCHCNAVNWLLISTDHSNLGFYFFNWFSPHARLYSPYEAWSYKKKKHKRLKHTGNQFRKNLQSKDISNKLLRPSQFLKNFWKFWNDPLYRNKSVPSPLLNVVVYWQNSNTEASAKKLSQIRANNINHGWGEGSWSQNLCVALSKKMNEK